MLLVAVGVGSLYAVYDARPFQWFPFLLAMVGAFFAHLGANSLHELLDYQSGAFEPPSATVLAGGEMSVTEAAWVTTGMFAAALFCGAALVPVTGATALLLGFLGFLLAVLYRVPPIALSYLGRGLGEAVVFIAFGPLSVLGGYYVQGGRISWGACMASLPLGIYATAVLYCHHFTRFEGDLRVGKITPVVAFGEAQALRGCWLLPAFAYLAVWADVALGEYPKACLIALLTAIPMAVELFRLKSTNPIETYRRLARATALLHTVTGILIASGFVWFQLSRK